MKGDRTAYYKGKKYTYDRKHTIYANCKPVNRDTTRQMCVWIDRDLHRQLKAICRKHQRTFSDEVSQLIKDYIANNC